jgi:putative tricarboxylic transport membrane protein
VLGGELERSLRLGLNLSDGNIVTFVTRPITATILIVTVAIMVFGVTRHLRMRRRMAAAEAGGGEG